MKSDSSGTPEPPAPASRLPEPMASVLASMTAAPSPGMIVDALVPACADLAWISVPIDGYLRVSAYAHIDPMRLSALADFQKYYVPAIGDSHSFMARVLRTGIPELVNPEALAKVERLVSSAGTRAALLALGARTSLIAPIFDAAEPTLVRAVLLTAMSSSGRAVDEDDLADLAQFARALSPRLRW